MAANYPGTGGPARGPDIPPVSYLQWYIPRLKENRQHNLSFSGLQFPWELEGIEDVWKDHRGPGIDERDLVSEMYRVPVDNVHLCMGATQGIALAISAASRGGKVAVEMPSYGPVSQTARILGLETIAVQRKTTDTAWVIDRDEWSTVLDSVDLLMVTPQLNPVGWSFTEDDRNWLVSECRTKDVRIISDEVYSRADRDWEPMFREGENCITISSLTKVHGLGVIRYGWIIADEKIIESVANSFHNMEGMMSSPSIRIVEHIKGRLDEPVKLIEYYREKNLPVLISALDRLGIHWTPPPYGVFGAFRIPGVNTIEMIDTIGKEHGLLAVPGSMFGPGLDEWLRVGWSIDPKSFAEAIYVLEEVIRTALDIT
jgi:aspartate/methionine/tyrosine aminotransferase